MTRSTTGQHGLQKLLATVVLGLWTTLSSATHLGIVVDGSTPTPQVWIQQDIFQFVDLHVDTDLHQAVITGYFPDPVFFTPSGTRSKQVLTGNVTEYFLFSAGDPMPNPFSPLGSEVQHFALTYLISVDGVPVPEADQIVTAGSLLQQCITASGALAFKVPPCETQFGEFIGVDVNGDAVLPNYFPTGFLLHAKAQAAPVPGTASLLLLGLFSLPYVRKMRRPGRRGRAGA